ncbi:hypothetical protein A2U01_0074926, partial [Trifolium medium]|nr:hypothetical protein [Trifolium medium]
MAPKQSYQWNSANSVGGRPTLYKNETTPKPSGKNWTSSTKP